jgi:hypothetical protein
MADEDTVLEEAMDNLKEAGQRIRATQSLMRSQGMTDGENYRDLLTRLTTALAMTEAAYLEAAGRLAKTNHGHGVPTSPKRPLENATYLAESMLILAQIVDEQLTPKKRGRPRKTA